MFQIVRVNPYLQHYIEMYWALHHHFKQFITRQLPMGAGHCQWGGFTDQNVCNIQRERVLRTPGRKEGRKARKYIMMMILQKVCHFSSC